MTAESREPAPNRDSFAGWLVRLNSQVSQWASSMSWGRLIVLILVILIAGSIISDQLRLKHDRIRVSGQNREIVVNIAGHDALRIGPRRQSDGATTAKPPAAGASRSEPTPPAELDADDEAWVGQQVITFRGILGDIGGVLMVFFFAYLVAAKIVVRKVAQADAKVRTAVDAAEHEAMERQLVQARLQVLQAQVEPHFLFNTLAAVDYLIETEPPRASRMQKALITYLRGALPEMRQQASTLGRELRLVRSYLELIKMRIEERLEIEIAVPEPLESAEFPPMMLQSLVENAIKHGIEPKPEGGKLRIAAGLSNGQLWVEVSDTGVGVPEGELLDGPTSGTGLGLRNIRERLAMLYPGKSRLMLRSDPSTGTLVSITVPYQVGTPSASGDSAAQGVGATQ